MNWKAIKIVHVVVVVAAILLAVLLYTFFSRTKPAPEAELYKKLIDAKDETIKAVQGERTAWEQVAAGKDTLIAAYKKQTVQYLQAASKNQIFYIENKKQYEAIPATVRNLSNDSLQRAIEQYYQYR